VALEGHPSLVHLRVERPHHRLRPEAEAQAAAWASLPLGFCPRLAHVDLGNCPLGPLDTALRQLASCAQLRALHITACRLPWQQRRAWLAPGPLQLDSRPAGISAALLG
jgi:hypothetical protein